MQFLLQPAEVYYSSEQAGAAERSFSLLRMEEGS